MKKISSLLVVLLLMLASFTAGVEYQRGDVDQDGKVNISDVTCLIDYLLSGVWPDEPVTPPDTHEYVDLGLPSGTLWATCNVGADTPEGYGDYFAWGETEPKEVYSLDTYKWYNHDDMYFTKYNQDYSSGYYDETGNYVSVVTPDGKTELDPEDDAAYVNWGPSWRMPTHEQQRELVEQCTWTWTTRNSVYGQQGTGPNGNTIFLPAAGWHTNWNQNDSLLCEGSYGCSWSRTLYPIVSDIAYILYSYSGSVDWSYPYARNVGCSVRAVRVSQN